MRLRTILGACVLMGLLLQGHMKSRATPLGPFVALIQDSSGFIWAMTEDGTIHRWEESTGAFYQYPPTPGTGYVTCWRKSGSDAFTALRADGAVYEYASPDWTLVVQYPGGNRLH